MGDAHRTITVKKGVRYNWRESLESILEDGELSKATVHPSGNLHLHVIRTKKNGSRRDSPEGQQCTLSFRVQLAKGMLNSGSCGGFTTRDQCVQTDCTIPVRCDHGRTEDVRLYAVSPAELKTSKPNQDYILAVPKTKPINFSKKPQSVKMSGFHRQSSMHGRLTNLSSEMSQSHGTSTTLPTKRWSPYRGETPTKSIAKRNYGRKSIGAYIGSSPKHTSTTLSLKSKRSKTLERRGKTKRKPTIGLAQLTSLTAPFQPESCSKLTLCQETVVPHSRQDTLSNASWSSHMQHTSHRHELGHNLSEYMHGPPEDIEPSRQYRVIDRYQNKKYMKGRFEMGYNSNSFTPTVSIRNLTDSGQNKKLERKIGSYTLQIQSPFRNTVTKNNRTQTSPYCCPSKLTWWPFLTNSSCTFCDNEMFHKVDDKWDLHHSFSEHNASNDQVPIGHHKIYSSYELLSEPSLSQKMSRERLATSDEGTFISDVYPSRVASQDSTLKSSDLQSFLLQIKNVLSSYFNNKLHLDKERQKPRKVNKIKHKSKMKAQDEKNGLWHEDLQRPTREMGSKLMGFRYCY